MKSYWEADEDEYVDVWYETIIDMLLKLKLIKRAFLRPSAEVYERLMRYKK